MWYMYYTIKKPTEPERSPTQENHVDGAGFARTQDGHGRDHAQSSLRANEQLLEVVARVVFAQRGQTVQHPAVCQNLDAKTNTHTHTIHGAAINITSSRGRRRQRLCFQTLFFIEYCKHRAKGGVFH